MPSGPHAIVIGAGFTGCAVAHDLALRGFSVTVVERGDIANGTSGRTHGLLHSGARYCVADQEAAVECIQENIILRRITKQCIEANGGLFVALDDDELEYAPRFTAGAEACGIPIEEWKPEKIRSLEPNLNPKVRLAYTVPDAAFDPLRLALAFAATAVSNRAQFVTYTDVTGFVVDGSGRVAGVTCWDRSQDRRYELRGDIVINAAGAWSGQIAEMAGVRVPVVPTPGVMVAYDRRPCQRVVNRLVKPSDGDILLPQRRMMVIGTTSYETTEPDYLPIQADQVELMHNLAVQLVPELAQANFRGVYVSSRPLIAGELDGRSLSRTFRCYDHEEEGLPGLVTITGGKATTCRIMAEKTVDLICAKLGYPVECATSETPLADYRSYYR